MNKVLTSVCGGAALLLFLAGCDPHLAEIESGSQEELWYKQLKANYPSFTPPPNPAPAVYSRTAVPGGTVAVAPADDPDRTVDKAADEKSAAPAPITVKDEKKADAPQELKADGAKADAKAAPQADAKAEAKADAKADAKNQAPAGRFYVVKAGDTLGSIAKHFYGKASMEDMIFRANSKQLKSRNMLSIGMRLVIPEL